MEIIGHRAATGRPRHPGGAAALAAALAGPADRVELDVYAFGGRLVVAHDQREAARPGGLTFDQALGLLGPSDRGLLADIKGAEVAGRLGRAIAERGLGRRTIVCGALDQVELACRDSDATPAWTLPTGRGWSIRGIDAVHGGGFGAVRRAGFDDPDQTPSAVRPDAVPRAPAGPLGWVTRRSLRRVQRAAVAGLEAGRCEVICVEERFVTPDLVGGVHRAGGRLLAWTVDDPAAARRLAGLGVDGLITNEPDLLAASVPAGSAQWSDG
ncbi:MAG TPA: glycerophosphodiester phosphodiesterase [Solirubrobacteraceae bacterium]